KQILCVLGSACACLCASLGSSADAASRTSPPPMPSQEQMREQILQMMGQGAPAKRGDAVEVVVQTGHAAAVTLVALSNDGRAVASGSLDESVKLWDVASGQAVRTFTGSPGIAPTTIAFSADGARLIVCDLESARVYDTSSGAQLFRVLSG